MGLFSAKRVVYVSSAVYNLAGEEPLRPHYLKTSVVGKVLNQNEEGMGSYLNSTYLNGPGISLRSFLRWADTHMEDVGMPQAVRLGVQSLDSETVAAQVPAQPSMDVWVQEAQEGPADFGMWVEKWFIENEPNLIDTEWSADFNEVSKTVTITYENASTRTLVLSDYDVDARYIFVRYSDVSGRTQTGSSTTGNIPLGTGAFPSLDGWDLVSEDIEPRAQALETETTVRKTYSDARPPEVTVNTTTRTENYNFTTRVYSSRSMNSEAVTGGVASITGEEYERTDWSGRQNDVTETVTTVTEPDPIDPLVTVTIETTVNEENLILNNTTKTDTAYIRYTSRSNLKMYIYKIGSGNPALDAMQSSSGFAGKFYPYIPVRDENEFFSEDYFPDTYKIAKKAYKKVIRSQYDDLIEELADNENLDDIDYAFIHFGVPLNIRDVSAKRYIYDFFKMLQSTQTLNQTDYNSFSGSEELYEESFDAWDAWRLAQGNPSNPLDGTPEPALRVRDSLPKNVLKITAPSGAGTRSYTMELTWNYVSSSSGSGLAKPDAKVGDAWVEFMGEDSFQPLIVYNNEGDVSQYIPQTVERIRVTIQKKETYEYVDVVGLYHRNYVYGGKFVEISAKEALEDTEESGLIIPLHYETLSSMSLIDYTQVSSVCNQLILNCYQIVKVKWYQRGIMKFLLPILMSAVLGPMGVGVLGSSAVIGTTLGFTGTLATIVGTVANSLAAMVLSTVVMRGAQAILGDKIGSIIGAILAVATVVGLTAFQMHGNMSAVWGELTKATNLLKLTEGLANGVANYYQAAVEGIMGDMQDYLDNANLEYASVEEKMLDMFGSRGVIDPLSFTDSYSVNMETSDLYLSRTMLSGSDISDLSVAMIENFAEMNLRLPDALG